MGARRGQALFCDVTVVSPLTRNGAPGPSARTTNGAALRRAERRKRTTYYDVHNSQVAELLVLGAEVFGRWSEDALSLVRELIALKVQDVQPLLRGSATAAYTTRWWNLLSTGLQRACAESLLSAG